MRIKLIIALFLVSVVSLITYAFNPPSKVTKLRAIGSIEYLSPLHKKIFADSDCFAPLPEPGRNDWLARHEEKGQTFSQFVAKRHPKPSKSKDTLYLQPIGLFNEKAPSLQLLMEYAEIYFNMPVKTMEAIDLNETKFTSRINPNGKVLQLHTRAILKYLSQHKPTDAYLVLGVTMTDLFPDASWNFVFGQANYANQVGIFSFARYHPDFYGWEVEGDIDTLILERSMKVMCHEMGHMFGIAHCIHYHCLMNGSNNLEESDNGPHHLCPVCLRKVHYQKPMDLIARYEKLQKFYQKHKIKDGLEFTASRLKELK